MKMRLTGRGWLVVLGLLLLAIALGLLLARASQWPAASGPWSAPNTDHRAPNTAPRGVNKSCVIRPVNVLEAGARKSVQKYYVTATATDVVPGRAEAQGEERRYELGQYREHEPAVDACMDWVRCPQQQ